MFTSSHSDVWEIIARTSELRVEPRKHIDNIYRNVGIKALSNDVLLEIFDLCLVENEDSDPCCDTAGEVDGSYSYDAWYTLAHVCQRWRHVVFASPRRLNLRLHCSRRRVREMLDVWPAFPIVIWDMPNFRSDKDNIIAALEHRDRVCEIKLGRFTGLQSKELVPHMRKSFPALTKLQIESPACDDIDPPDFPNLPDSFLGGSAPHLRFLSLTSISFRAFPNLLRSASNLVHLYLNGTPSGYISPAMIAALPALTKLKVMHLFFRHPVSDTDLEDPALLPLTRSVLSALQSLELGGDAEYLDDFVARIEVPSIKYLKIEFSDQLFSHHDVVHLPQLICRVKKFRSFDFAVLDLSPNGLDVTLSPRRQTLRDGSHRGALQLKFLCNTDGPLQALVDACNISLVPLSNIEKIHISAPYLYWGSQSGFNKDNPLLLQVLREFSAAKSLSLASVDLVPPIAFALKQVIETGMTGVLPAIQELTVPGSLSAGHVRVAILAFVRVRGLKLKLKR